MSVVIQSNIQLWRQKSRDGTITLDEMRQAISAIRADRLGADAVSTISKERKATATAKKIPIDSNAMLAELGL